MYVVFEMSYCKYWVQLHWYFPVSTGNTPGKSMDHISKSWVSCLDTPVLSSSHLSHFKIKEFSSSADVFNWSSGMIVQFIKLGTSRIVFSRVSVKPE